VYDSEVARAAPLIPYKGIRIIFNITLRIIPAVDVILLYCGKPRPAKSDMMIFHILSINTPGKRINSGYIEPKNWSVYKKGMSLPATNRINIDPISIMIITALVIMAVSSLESFVLLDEAIVGNRTAAIESGR